jgi:hypothetical protein
MPTTAFSYTTKTPMLLLRELDGVPSESGSTVAAAAGTHFPSPHWKLTDNFAQVPPPSTCPPTCDGPVDKVVQPPMPGHVRLPWKHLRDVPYPLLDLVKLVGVGCDYSAVKVCTDGSFTVRVAEPNSTSRYHLVRASRILPTLAIDQLADRARLNLCAHFENKGLCLFGSACRFVHRFHLEGDRLTKTEQRAVLDTNKRPSSKVVESAAAQTDPISPPKTCGPLTCSKPRLPENVGPRPDSEKTHYEMSGDGNQPRSGLRYCHNPYTAKPRQLETFKQDSRSRSE